MKTTRLFSLLQFFLLAALSTQAQTWRWATSGGSVNNSSVWGYIESVRDIATDRNGNVYTISMVGNHGITVSGDTIQPWLAPQFMFSTEVMINSFTCTGTLRWSKLIGCENGFDFGYALRTDSADGVYAAMELVRMSSPAAVLHVDADTVVNGISHKSLYLVKYDTAGNYQWLTGPQADTVSYLGSWYASWQDMDADGQGNLYCLMYLDTGAYGGPGGFAAATHGNYIVKYNRDGILTGATLLDVNTSPSGFHGRLARDPSNGHYYIAGALYGKIFLGNDSITHNMYIVAFGKDGKYLWKRENNMPYQTGFSGRPLLDGAGHIYLSGATSAGDHFNGYTVTTPGGGIMPFIAKMDTTGKHIWANAAEVRADCGGHGVALRNSGEVDLIADAGFLRWPGSNDSASFGYVRPTITRFNTQTGKVLGIDTVIATTPGPPGWSYPAATPTAITAAGGNSVYVGGNFVQWLSAGNNALTSTGGQDDFFLTRWGYDTCGCNDIPEPLFTSTFVYWNTFQFTYTGSQPYNSLLWDFGDGITSTQLSPTHLFAGGKTFNVTVTVTNGCGDNTYGGVIQTVGVNDVQNHRLAIYPNPATDRIIIEGAVPGSILHLFNLTGQLFRTETINENMTIINLGDLPAGQYFIKLSAPNGAGHVQQFLKQPK